MTRNPPQTPIPTPNEKEHRPQIAHLISERTTDLGGFLTLEGNLSGESARNLILFGAIYLNKKRARSTEMPVREGDYIRIHYTPKKYDYSFTKDNELIIFEDEWVVVCDKPAGLPVHPMLDNSQQNLIALLKREANINALPAHRIDNETRGLVVFAKDSQTHKELQREWKSKKLEKKYLALTRAQVKTGKLIHYMKDSKTAPKIMSDIEFAHSKRSELEVISSVRETPSCFLSEINLITGRTHQIRAQLSFTGTPLLGDVLYGGPSIDLKPDLHIGLIASRILFSLPSKDREYDIKLPYGEKRLSSSHRC